MERKNSDVDDELAAKLAQLELIPTKQDTEECKKGEIVGRRSSLGPNGPEITSMDDFVKLLILGKGAFGKVYLAKYPQKNGEDLFYAIKCIKKHVLLEENKIAEVENEKMILLELDHPFLATMDYLFTDDQRLYFVMPFIQGAEFYKFYLKNGCRFEEK